MFESLLHLGNTRTWRRAFAACALLMVASLARGACTEKDFEPGWLINYDGTIGAERVRLTLTASPGLSGVYLYASELKDIQVAGRISNGRLTLNEFDGRGGIRARFEGEFLDRDPRGQSKGPLRCEVIAGSWQAEGATQTWPFFLAQDSGTSGTLEHRYAVAGAEDDELIHRNAFRSWQGVVQGNKAVVASLINYPIEVRIAGTRRQIRNQRELILQYDAIFFTAYRKAIAGAIPRNMFVRDYGIMLGRGEVWFGPSGKVFALNNMERR